VRILEGYGLTETSPVLAINSPVAARVGSVGKPLPNVECCIAGDGELLVRGPNVFKGYWKKIEETQASFNADGWFFTGDIARIDDDGFLYVTDRKKELLKTSGGKLIAPQPIENRLKANYLVAHAALVGDRHKFASVLIAPNFIALQEWALDQGIVLTSRSELVEHPTVSELYKGIIDDVNAGLANFETVKRFRIVAEEWSLDTGELTPSLKLKRRVITERYAVHIAEFYVDEATSRA
jgi:long-chain acyl-CoA synthetase